MNGQFSEKQIRMAKMQKGVYPYLSCTPRCLSTQQRFKSEGYSMQELKK
jgi:hypothetical protein